MVERFVTSAGHETASGGLRAVETEAECGGRGYATRGRERVAARGVCGAGRRGGGRRGRGGRQRWATGREAAGWPRS